MSSEHQALVFNATGIKGPEVLLLLAVCDNTDAHGHCTSGIKRLAHKTGTSESTVKATIKRLEANNLLKKLERRDGKGVSQHNVYRVNLDLLRSMHDPYFDDSDNIIEQLQFTPVTSDNDLSTGGSGFDPPPRIKLSTGGSKADGGGSELDPRGSGSAPSGGSKADGGQNSTHPHPDTDTERKDPERKTSPKTKAEKTPEVSENDRRAAQAILDRHDLEHIDPTGKQPVQIRDAVARAFAAKHRAPDVDAYFAMKLAEANTVKFLVGAFATFRLPEITNASRRSHELSPPCGNCDARPEDPLANTRVIWLDDARTRSKQCPNCHPDAIASALSAIAG